MSYLTSSRLSVHPAQYYFMYTITGVINSNHDSVKGKKNFHRRFIRISYRNRGIVLRAQINIRDIIVVFKSSSVLVYLLLIIEIVISLINRIFIYSAIKIRANGDLLYSILKPDTNSDSPSAKSNGVRCVSANIEINQAMISGIVKRITHIY